MTDRNDLTRWNRAGLRSLTYVDGNAPLFLDELRAALKDRFPSAWTELQPSERDVEGDKPEAVRYQRNRKIVEQYYGGRQDPGWEIARAVSRSCHVLTGKVDAFANEAFIRTATQWDNLRRLVELIDYHPATATSASTEIALLAKPGRKGIVKKGFQVRYTPPEGGPPVIFETLADVEIDPDLNALRPKGWNRAEGRLVPEDDSDTDSPVWKVSKVALGPVVNIQDVGLERSQALDTLIGNCRGVFRIADLVGVDPANPGFPVGIDISETWLREFKTKAIAIANFGLDAGWEALLDWRLPEILAEGDTRLAMITGRTIADVGYLKRLVGRMGAFLDQAVFEQTYLRDLVPSEEIADPRHVGNSTANEGDPQAPTNAPGFSKLALEPAGVMRGVGPEQSAALDSIVDRGKDGFKVADFLTIDPENPQFPEGSINIPEMVLRLLKARAIAIVGFQLESGWSDIVDWTLARIAEKDPEALSETTGKSAEEVGDLRSRVALIGSYLEYSPPLEAVPLYSKLALAPAKALRGVGTKRSAVLDNLRDGEQGSFRINDFLTLDPADPAFPEPVDVPEIWLRELKAYATAVVQFRLDGEWSRLADWMLPAIIAEPSEELARIAYRTPGAVDDLKRQLEIMGFYIDRGEFVRTPLKHLFVEHEETRPETPVDGVRRYPPLAFEAVSAIQGVGPVGSRELDTLAAEGSGGYKIKDFLELDPANPGFPEGAGMPEHWLREYKNKATELLMPQRWDEWSDIWDWTLPRIARESFEVLTRTTGRTLAEIEDLKFRVELIGAYLDDSVYQRTNLSHLITPKEPMLPHPVHPDILEQVRLGDLIAPTVGKQPTVIRTSWQKPKKPKVSSGQVAMAFHLETETGEAVTVERVDDADNAIHLRPSPWQRNWPGWSKGASRLFVTPRWRRKCWLNGADVIRTAAPHGLAAGAFVAWETGGRWKFAEVTEADEWNLRLHVKDALPVVGTPLYEARPVDAPIIPAELTTFGTVEEQVQLDILDYSLQLAKKSKDLFYLVEPLPVASAPPLMPPGKLDFGSFLFPTPMLPADLVKAAVEILLSIGVMEIPSTGDKVFKFLSNPGAVANMVFDQITKAVDGDKGGWLIGEPPSRLKQIEDIVRSTDEQTVLFKEMPADLLEESELSGPILIVLKDPPVKANVAATDPRYVFDGDPGKAESGSWIVGHFSDGPRALRIRTMAAVTGGENPETFSLGFDDLVGNEGELRTVYGDFRGELAAMDSNINVGPVDPQGIDLGLDEMPAAMKPGRPVLLTPAGDGPEPKLAKIVEVSDKTIRTEPPPEGFTKYNLVIRANVAAASHGATKPVKRLGSGIVSAGQHSVLLEVENVSSVPDSTFPAGARADIEVEIDGMIWTQVPRLNDSGPTASHYAVRATEERRLRLVFGDGRRGRRLPAGASNIRVGYRVGAGRAGNLPAASLIKQVNPNPFVEGVEQPLSSSGGEEMESVVNMRDRAPATLLALERAVSLADFDNLGASRNDVWQARAFHRPHQGGHLDRIQVVIVPSGGGELGTPLKDAITAYLSENAVPTVAVEVVGFKRKRVSLTVSVRIDSAKFIPILVVEQVRQALLTNFAIERRPIARPLYLSEIYHVVEGVEGVADSECVIEGDPAQRRVPAAEDEVVYLDKRLEDLKLTSEDYVP